MISVVRPDGSATPSKPHYRAARKSGGDLRVRFLSGTANQQQILKDFAPKWCDHANNKLDFNNAPNADIRISFDPSDGRGHTSAKIAWGFR